MPLGKPGDDGTIHPSSRHYGGGSGNLGVASVWKCPGCGAQNSGRTIEQGCAVCGAGDPTKGRAGAPPVATPEGGRVRLPPGGPASEHPSGRGENGVAPRPAAIPQPVVRVLRLLEYVFEPGADVDAILRRSLVGRLNLGNVTLTATIVDDTSARQEDLLSMAHRQPGVWLANPERMQADTAAPPAAPWPWVRTAVLQEFRTRMMPPPDPPPPPDTGLAFSAYERDLAESLIALLGNSLAHTIALALGSIAEELSGNSEPERFVTTAECLRFANAIMDGLPQAWGAPVEAAVPPSAPQDTNPAIQRVQDASRPTPVFRAPPPEEFS